MQILTINNRNFQKPSRNPSNRTKVKILKKKIFGIAHQKNLVCSVTAERFEHPNSRENRRKRSKKIFENLRREYKDLIYVKKNSKLSHACVPLILARQPWSFAWFFCREKCEYEYLPHCTPLPGALFRHSNSSYMCCMYTSVPYV
jgi:hypothetical protein